MINDRYRRTLTYLLLAVALAASALYDTVLMQIYERIQQGLAGLMAICFAAIIALQRHSLRPLSRALVSAWPLHLYSLAFIGVCVGFHGGWRLSQVLAYTYFAYATYFMLPLILRLDRAMFQAVVRLVMVMSAVLAIPSFFGGIGFVRLGIFPLRVKPSYAQFSGIIASGGIFEHAEGHALQMGFGILCAIYLLQYSAGIQYLLCLVLATLGLVVSQGRAAIYGLAVAACFHFLPKLFRQSRTFFLGTFAFLLLFPFIVWPVLAMVPGVSSYLRIERGLSGRGEAWEFAWEAIRERPVAGHGFMASTALTESEQKSLRRAGFSGAGTTFHNTFISKAVDLGVVATGLYFLLYFVPMWRLCRDREDRLERDLLQNMLILIITTSIYRDYNIGGVRSTVFIGAIFLGLANLWYTPHLTAAGVVPDPSALEPATE